MVLLITQVSLSRAHSLIPEIPFEILGHLFAVWWKIRDTYFRKHLYSERDLARKRALSKMLGVLHFNAANFFHSHKHTCTHLNRFRGENVIHLMPQYHSVFREFTIKAWKGSKIINFIASPFSCGHYELFWDTFKVWKLDIIHSTREI